MTAGAALVHAQEKITTFKVKVDMVVLSFQVQNSKGGYINGLKHTDFRIYEDGILQRISTFAEGAKAPLAIGEDGSTHPLLEARKDLPGMERPDAFVGTMAQLLCALEENREPEISGRDNLETIALCEAVYAAAQEHRVTTVKEMMNDE